MLLGLLEQPRQDKISYTATTSPMNQTMDDARIPFFVLLESPFASVSTVSRGHPFIVSLGKSMGISIKVLCHHGPALDLKGVPVAVFPSGLSRKVTACALYSSLPRNIRLNTHRKDKVKTLGCGLGTSLPDLLFKRRIRYVLCSLSWFQSAVLWNRNDLLRFRF